MGEAEDAKSHFKGEAPDSLRCPSEADEFASHEDLTAIKIPKAKERLFNNQLSVLDFVRVENPRRLTAVNMVNCFRLHFSVKKRLLFFLTFLGLFSGLVDIGIRAAIEGLSDLRALAIDQHKDSNTLSFIIWSSFSVLLVLTAVHFTAALQPAAAGSGLPEIKCILAGSDIPGYFTMRTLVAKILGLIGAAGSGLSIGREGPFVHITCIIAHQFLKLPAFLEFNSSKSYRLQIMAAAAAAGVASNFTAPLGGVLFSIEVTASFYLLDNYWKSFLSAMSAATVATLIRVIFIGDRGYEQIFQTNYPKAPYEAKELPLFLLLGVIMGLLGGTQIQAFNTYGSTLKKLKVSRFESLIKHIILPVGIALVTSAITYLPGKFMQCSLTECTQAFVSEKELPLFWKDWGEAKSLAFFGISYYILTPFSISLSLPCGVFIPSLAAGSALGRCFGTILNDSLLGWSVFPGAYALAGGAALAAGVTRTISAGVIILEITGQQAFVLPVFLSVLSAYGVGTILSRSIFDVILINRDLPFLSIISPDENLKVKDVMDSEVLKLTRVTTYAKILLTLNLLDGKSVPVVNDEKHLLLLGNICKADLSKLVIKLYTINRFLQADVDLGASVPDSGNNSASSFSNSISTLKSAFNGREGTAVSKWGTPLNECGSDVEKSGRNGRLSESLVLKLMMESWSDNKKKVLSQEVDIIEACGLPILQPTILTIPHMTPLCECHTIFVMMRCSRLYVTYNGSLVGQIRTTHIK